MDLLRFSTAGSVDDGKSTLIGRLLYDAKGVFEDQLEAVARSAVNRASVGIDLSLLTDGLRAEREQGITIDVAYRYFATPRRKFIIADTPGHEQYTRNMATGASTADVAVVLIDARHGALVQSRRHTFIAALLGIPHVVVAVNKMDLVQWSAQRFAEIVEDFKQFTSQLGIASVTFIPLSALLGDNVVTRSEHMPWYDGPPLLEHLETVQAAPPVRDEALRFPVQLVIRPNLDYRGFAGQIASGTVRVGDEVVALPAGTRTRIRQIDTYDGPLETATAPQSVTLLLQDEIDVSRGDMLVHAGSGPWVRRTVDADIVWMDGQPLDPDRPYLVQHTTRQVRGKVAQVLHRVDVNTLHQHPATALQLNETGRIRLHTAQPLYVDAYADCRRTGSFVLIDPLSHATVAAGMVCRDQPDEDALLAALPQVDRRARELQGGHRAAVLWLEGGTHGQRQALGRQLEARLFQRGSQVVWIDPAAAAALAPRGVAVPLLRWLVATGHLVVADGAVADALTDGLDAQDRVVVQLAGEAGVPAGATGHDDGLPPLDVASLGADVAAAKVVAWLGDRGVFGAPALLTPGAGI